MPNNNLLAVRSPAPAQLDPATHLDCLELIRSAIASADQQTAHHIAAALKDCYQRGYIDRAAIWRDLTPIEQQQFQELLGPPPLAREAGPENLRGDRLQLARCGLRHRERVERCDRRWPTYSSRCCGGCGRSAIPRF